MLTHKLTQNCIGDILLELLLISMYFDEHEFDYETLVEHVAEEIWQYKKS